MRTFLASGVYAKVAEHETQRNIAGRALVGRELHGVSDRVGRC